MPVVAMVAAAVVGAAFAVVLTRMVAGRRAAQVRAAASAEAAALVHRSRMAATASRTAAETRAREQGLELRRLAEEELEAARVALEEREQALAVAAAEVEAAVHHLDLEHGAIDERVEVVNQIRDRARAGFEAAEACHADAVARLEAQAGQGRDDVRQVLSQRWIEDASAAAAARVRAIDLGQVPDARYDESARRLMEISVARYRNHFLTERSISRLPLADGVAELLAASDGLVHRSLEQVSNVQMHLDESGEFLRLEGLDGVGREVARRAISRLGRKPTSREKAQADPAAWATKIRENLDREIMTLGRKAFTVLEIERADDEIVGLVGALNYRTSYTQNQWLHAVEASFLCGMMAQELGLDLKIARRATLMHDIGKALTHKIEGSHAVIGADIARRLGEDEVIANAIGAHHLDEPMNSAYAFLVAAADAMSGARPGARREFEGGYSTRLSDLERIGQQRRGVDRAYAVHGGRELRVYVRDGEVSDLDAIELSAEIAEQVSEEMTFPGQIKVTVIRAFEAVSTAN